MRLPGILGISIFLFYLACSDLSAENGTARFRIGFMASPPTIDGSQSSANWPAHEWAFSTHLSGFTAAGGLDAGAGSPAVRVGYDAENLYVGFAGGHGDGSEAISTAQSDALEEIVKDPSFECVIAREESSQGLVHFAINTAGRLGGIFQRAGQAPAAWKTAAVHHVTTTAKGWELEVAIPWKDLGVENPQPSDSLRVNFQYNPGRNGEGSSAWQAPGKEGDKAFRKEENLAEATFGKGQAVAGVTYDLSETGEMAVVLRGATTAPGAQTVHFYMNDGKRPHGWKLAANEQSRRTLQYAFPKTGEGIVKLRMVDEIGGEAFYEHTARFQVP